MGRRVGVLITTLSVKAAKNASRFCSQLAIQSRARVLLPTERRRKLPSDDQFRRLDTLLTAKSFPRSRRSALEAVESLKRAQDSHRKEEGRPRVPTPIPIRTPIPKKREHLPVADRAGARLRLLLQAPRAPGHHGIASDDQEATYLSSL